MKMNNFFRLYYYFIKYYIDDIIIFSRNPKKYFEYLKIIFYFFAKFKIIFIFKKFYFKYLLITLLK